MSAWLVCLSVRRRSGSISTCELWAGGWCARVACSWSLSSTLSVLRAARFFVGWRGAFAREGLVLRRAFGACAAAIDSVLRVVVFARRHCCACAW